MLSQLTKLVHFIDEETEVQGNVSDLVQDIPK